MLSLYFHFSYWLLEIVMVRRTERVTKELILYDYWIRELCKYVQEQNIKKYSARHNELIWKFLINESAFIYASWMLPCCFNLPTPVDCHFSFVFHPTYLQQCEHFGSRKMNNGHIIGDLDEWIRYTDILLRSFEMHSVSSRQS